jgi:hypothetical protein
MLILDKTGEFPCADTFFENVCEKNTDTVLQREAWDPNL